MPGREIESARIGANPERKRSKRLSCRRRLKSWTRRRARLAGRILWLIIAATVLANCPGRVLSKVDIRCRR